MAYKDRWPKLRDPGSDGYNPSGRENFDNVVEIAFDFSDINAKSQRVRKELSDFNYQIYKIMSKLDVDEKSGFIYPSKKLRQVRTMGSMDKVFTLLPDAERLMPDIMALAKITADEGKTTMKKYIGSRIETGRMVGSVYGRTYKKKDGVLVRIGWLDLWYKYFGFQENGTNKIKPMRAVLRTYLEIAPQVRKALDEYFRSYSGSAGKPKASQTTPTASGGDNFFGDSLWP